MGYLTDGFSSRLQWRACGSQSLPERHLTWPNWFESAWTKTLGNDQPLTWLRPLLRKCRLRILSPTPHHPQHWTLLLCSKCSSCNFYR
jgi:hypothetical protein